MNLIPYLKVWPPQRLDREILALVQMQLKTPAISLVLNGLVYFEISLGLFSKL